MTRKAKISVIYDEDQRFTAGSPLTGQLNVRCKRRLQAVSGIRLQLLGLTRIRPSCLNREFQQVCDESFYFDVEGRAMAQFGPNPATIEPGDVACAFSIPIPDNIPSSFSCELGDTRYTIQATLVRSDPSKRNIESSISEVKVVNLGDFRANARVQLGRHQLFVHRRPFTRCCRSFGRVELRALLCKQGVYSPGEVLQVLTKCSNECAQSFDVQISLVEFVQTSRSDAKAERLLARTILPDQLDPQETEDVTVDLQIPEDVVTDSMVARCFAVFHRIRVELVTVAWPHKKATLELPVDIGHVARNKSKRRRRNDSGGNAKQF